MLLFTTFFEKYLNFLLQNHFTFALFEANKIHNFFEKFFLHFSNSGSRIFFLDTCSTESLLSTEIPKLALFCVRSLLLLQLKNSGKLKQFPVRPELLYFSESFGFVVVSSLYHLNTIETPHTAVESFRSAFHINLTQFKEKRGELTKCEKEKRIIHKSRMRRVKTKLY